MATACMADELVVITSRCDEPDAIAADLARGIAGRRLAGALVFCSHRLARQPLASAIQRVVGAAPVVGCTSAGELSDRGYDEDCVVFVGFPADSFRMAVHCFDDLDHFDPARGGQAIRSLGGELGQAAPGSEGFAHQAALFLVDGLSHREELLAMTVQEALGKTLLVGGSSGDGMLFRETGILVDGRFQTDAAVVVLLASRKPLRAFSAQHYEPGADKMVVTAADPNARVVHAINARPAAEEYARLAGGATGPLDPHFFAGHPPMVRAGGGHYVRAIQSVNADGSLTFYCAIDTGVVLTVGQPLDPLAQLEGLLDRIDGELGGTDHVIAFDCVLNRIDAENRQLSGAVSQLYARRRVVGFSTYGEQFRAAHINQTFTGLAIGR